MQRCDKCKFYDQIDALRGKCRRYPEPMPTGPELWCGEWKGKPKPKRETPITERT